MGVLNELLDIFYIMVGILHLLCVCIEDVAVWKSPESFHTLILLKHYNSHDSWVANTSYSVRASVESVAMKNRFSRETACSVLQASVDYPRY